MTPALLPVGKHPAERLGLVLAVAGAVVLLLAIVAADRVTPVSLGGAERLLTDDAHPGGLDGDSASLDALNSGTFNLDPLAGDPQSGPAGDLPAQSNESQESPAGDLPAQSNESQESLESACEAPPDRVPHVPASHGSTSPGTGRLIRMFANRHSQRQVTLKPYSFRLNELD
ncbi:hypothetical protein UY3_15628 [Chelonia mydas]|uniref:Uncharacterized protein n=1 Tax=Chelonia mydas TaxID=8469 RepID=M7B571_CHEMY|nr:hypothetical protein UY3_15628 [Chelonia mydas]